MPTTVSTTPVQLNDGTAAIVHIGNTGDPGRPVTLAWGGNTRSLDPGFSADIKPAGSPITAVTSSGSTTLTVDTTGVPPGPGGGGSGGGAVSSVVGQTGAVTGSQIASDAALTGPFGLYANVRDPRFAGGAVGDTNVYGPVTTSVSSQTVTSGGSFPTGCVGKLITLRGAGPGGTDLTTSITARASSSSITVADAASTATTGNTTIGSDDTAAFDAARAASKAIVVPTGVYTYNGAGLEADGLTIQGVGRGASVVYLGSGKSLITSTGGAIDSLTVRGLKILRGYGAVRLTSTALSVQYPLTVEDNHFGDYAGAAISSLASDQPYWMIARNTFRALNDVSTFGISLNGNNGPTVIEKNQFLTNGVNIKLGGRGGGAVKVDANDFIRFGDYSTASRIDVWVSGPAGSVIGGGLVISNNKFGSENIDSRDYRVLIAEADDATGFDDATRRPKLGVANTIIAKEILMTGNLNSGASLHGTPPFLVTATPRLRACRITDHVLNGAIPQYLVQYLFAPSDDAFSDTNIAGPFLGQGAMLADAWASLRICNYVGFWSTTDDTGIFQQPDAGLVSSGGGDRVGVVPLVSRSPALYNASGTATLAAAVDALGGVDAATVTVATAGDGVYAFVPNAALQPGVPVWVEFDAISAGASPAANLLVDLGTGITANWRRAFAISTNWRKYRYRWVPRTGTTTDRLTFSLAAGTGTFRIGRIRVYHAQEPVAVNSGDPKRDKVSRALAAIRSAPNRGIGLNGSSASTTADVPTLTHGTADTVTANYQTVGGRDVSGTTWTPLSMSASSWNTTYGALVNTTNGSSSAATGWGFTLTGTDVEITWRAGVSGELQWIWVDGKPITADPAAPSGLTVTAGTQYRTKLTFSTAGVRRIEFYALYGGLVRMRVPYGTSTVSPLPSVGPGLFTLGDSYLGSSAQIPSLQTWGRRIGFACGFNLFQGGQGGSGFLQAGTGEALTSPLRLDPVIAAKPDLILCWMGGNDAATTPSTLQAAAATTMAYLAAGLPTTPMIQVGTYPCDATTTMTSGRAAVNKALRDASIMSTNVVGFIDAIGNATTGTVPATWTNGETLAPGDLRTYNGTVYRVNLAMTAAASPDSTVSALTWLTGTGNASSPANNGSRDLLLSNDNTHWTFLGAGVQAQRIMNGVEKILASWLSGNAFTDA